MASTKKCSIAAFLSYVEEQPVLGHKLWHIKDLVSFVGRDCGTWNFHHEKNKKRNSPGLAEGLTDFFSVRQKEKMQNVKWRKKKILCIARVKTDYKGATYIFSSFCLESCLLSFPVPSMGLFSFLLCLNFEVTELPSWYHISVWGVRGCWDFENSYKIITDKAMQWRPTCGKQLLFPGKFKARQEAGV